MQSNLSTFFSAALLLLFFFKPLQAQDLSLNMTLLGNWDVDTLPLHSGGKYNDVWGYADCSGREYAILGSVGRIHFIDVTKPDEPREVASFPGTVNSIWRDFKTYKDRAYACADQGQDGLMVFDLSRLPDTVIMTYQSTEFFNRSHNLWVDTLQGRLYMAGANTRNNGLIIFDLTENPDLPQLLASTPLPGAYVHDIHVVDHIGYASHGFNGLWVYDFTDPENPEVLGSITDYPEKGYNHSSWLSPDGNFIVMADETHGTSLKVVDVQDNEDIYVRSLFKSTLLEPEHTGSIVHNPFIRGQYVILAYYHDGIQIYDMSNPDSVFRVAYYDTHPINTTYSGYRGAWGAYPYLPSGNILGSDITFGLFILSADSIEFLPGPRHRFPDAEIITDNPAFCEASTVLLEAAPGAESYTWLLDGAPFHAEGSRVEIGLDGYYQVEARNGHCIARSDSAWVQEVTPPEPPQVIVTGNTLHSADTISFAFYQWYLNGQPIPGANSAEYMVSESGYYSLEVRDDFGCAAFSVELMVIFSNVDMPGLAGLSLFPNPASAWVTIRGNIAHNCTLVLRDALGREVLRSVLPAGAEHRFSVEQLPQGMYLYTIEQGSIAGAGRAVQTGKLVILR